MIKQVLGTLIVVMLIATSCLKGGNNNYSSCSYDPCSTKAPDSQVVRLESYLSANNITATKHCSGLYYSVVTPGTGDAPTACSAVLVNYKGMLTNGTVFDSSANPVSFSLLTLIQGWANAVPLIKRGGEIKIYVPPALGYGAKDYLTIPANSILIFDVNLLDWQ